MLANPLNLNFFPEKSLAKYIDIETVPGGSDNGILKYYMPDGQWLMHGDIVTRPDLADTLQILAEKGSDAFYSGRLGEEFVSTVRVEHVLKDILIDLMMHTVSALMLYHLGRRLKYLHYIVCFWLSCMEKRDANKLNLLVA